MTRDWERSGGGLRSRPGGIKRLQQSATPQCFFLVVHPILEAVRDALRGQGDAVNHARLKTKLPNRLQCACLEHPVRRRDNACINDIPLCGHVETDRDGTFQIAADSRGRIVRCDGQEANQRSVWRCGQIVQQRRQRLFTQALLGEPYGTKVGAQAIAWWWPRRRVQGSRRLPELIDDNRFNDVHFRKPDRDRIVRMWRHGWQVEGKESMHAE